LSLMACCLSCRAFTASMVPDWTAWKNLSSFPDASYAALGTLSWTVPTTPPAPFVPSLSSKRIGPSDDTEYFCSEDCIKQLGTECLAELSNAELRISSVLSIFPPGFLTTIDGLSMGCC